MRRIRQSKPNYRIPVDRSNTMTKGLQLAYFFNMPGYAAFTDYANNFQTLSSPGVTTNTILDREGRVLDFTDDVGILSGTYNLSNGFCIIGKLRHDTGATDQALLGVNVVPQKLFLWRDEFASGDRYGFGVNNSSDATQIAYSSTKSALNTYYTVAASTDATTSASGTHRIYVDGVEEATASGDLHSDYSSQQIRVGATGTSGTPSRKLDGKISWLFLFDRPKSAIEIKSLMNNPYQILQPRTQYVGVEVVAAAGRINSLAYKGGLAGHGGIAGQGGGLAG